MIYTETRWPNKSRPRGNSTCSTKEQRNDAVRLFGCPETRKQKYCVSPELLIVLVDVSMSVSGRERGSLLRRESVEEGKVKSRVMLPFWENRVITSRDIY